MITIAQLKKELEKFPDDALCYAYEGEVTGIIINSTDGDCLNQGVIYCSEGDDSLRTTEALKSKSGTDDI